MESVGSYTVQRYRKKPVVIEAIRYVGSNMREVIEFTEGKAWPETCTANLVIPTLEGNHVASFGDYIIKGVRGEFYPCKPSIFWETYEPVTD